MKDISLPADTASYRGATVITAHSGCEGTKPNSREHIEAAIVSGAEIIEVDVRCRDGRLYLSHDAASAPESCVSLAECFSMLAPTGLKINCDLKEEALALPVMCLAARYGLRRRVIFTGQANTSAAVQSLGCEVWLSLWDYPKDDRELSGACETARAGGMRCLNLPYRMAAADANDRMKASGGGLSVWTADDEADIDAMLRLGVYNITTRRPVLALALRDKIQGKSSDGQALPEEAIFALLRQAGQTVREADGRVGKNAVRSKDGFANYVTEYDVGVQSFLENGLRALVPDAGFFAEESGENKNRVGKGLTFVIDPIDGTSNFIHGFRASAISVGLLNDGQPVWGAVYLPFSDELFHAAKGRGAYNNGKRISVSGLSLDDSLALFGTSPYSREKLGEKTLEIIRRLYGVTVDVRRSGCAAMDLCYVACGRASAFCELTLSPWDYAAGALIVTEAGGIVTRFDGSPLSFSTPSSVLASNAACRRELSALVDGIK